MVIIFIIVLLLALKGLSNCAKTIRAEQKRQAAKIAKHDREIAAHAKAIEKHEKQLQKHEEEIHKLNYKLNKAENDIDFLITQLDHFKEYGKYLEIERDACVFGSSNWHKWNNKLNTNDAKVYRLSDQLGRAYEEKQTAIRKLEVA